MSIQYKFFIPLVLLVLFFTAIGFDIANKRIESAQESAATRIARHKQAEIEQIIRTLESKSREQAAVFVEHTGVKEAYQSAAAGNMDDPYDPRVQEAREALRKEMRDYFQGFDKVFGSEHELRLHFHLPNGRSFLRAWREQNAYQAGEWVDKSDSLMPFRGTVAQVMRYQEPVQGLEVGRGGFVVRSVLPVFGPEESYLGSVEVLKDLDYLWEDLDLEEAHHLHLFMNREYEPLMDRELRKDFSSEYKGEYVLLRGEQPEAMQGLRPADLDEGREELFVRVQEGQALATFPVHDYQDKQIGVMAMFVDISEQQSTLGLLGKLIWGVPLAIMLFFLWVGRSVLHEVVLTPIQNIRSQISKIHRDSEDTSTLLEVRTSDELGNLTRDFNQLMDRYQQLVVFNRSVLDAIPDPVFVVDENFYLIHANRATMDLAPKQDPEGLRYYTCQELFNADCCGTPQCPIQTLKRGEKVDPSQIIRWDREDGQVMYIRPRARVLRDREGNIAGYLELAQDVTSLMEKEQELERLVQELRDMNLKYLDAARQAKEASEAKSQFLANMSHEIRTPMNAIIGMTQLAQHTDLTSDQQEYLSIVQSSAQALLSILNDVLDFSKIEAGKLDLDHTRFSLRETVYEATQSVAMLAHNKGLELNVRVDPALEDEFMGDPERIRQILVNLVGNSIKFTEHGEVQVDVRSAAEGKTASDRQWIRFLVTDTGPGIEPEKQSRIFEAFSQGDASTEREYGGTGLGLSICSSLVHMMNGEIGLESKPGEGSTFSFDLPLESAWPDQQGQVLGSVQQLAGLRVLVVDDNVNNAKILEELLKHWEMVPFVANSGSKALELLDERQNSQEPLHVMLLDLHMPDMDGTRVLEAMHDKDFAAWPSVLVLTSGAQLGEAKRLRALGIKSYLFKPAKQSRLLEAILEASSGKDQNTGWEQAPLDDTPELKRLNILLAEDNEINQRLAIKILSSQGHRVRAVFNGEEALQAWKEEEFDLVLMDVQMPRMDGLEATRRIREQERDLDKSTPIIALTAHALKGDRERCLQAGMDSYVQKPIRTEALWQEIRGVLRDGDKESGDSEEDQVENVESSPAADLERALQSMGEDEDLLQELARNFLDTYQQYLDKIRAAVNEGEPHSLTHSAHTLKGMLAVFRTAEAEITAKELEFMGRNQDMDGAEEALQKLEREVAEVEKVLKARLQV